MLILRLSNGVFTPNQKVTIKLFEQVRNTLVRVICEPLYYGDTHTLESLVCYYMNSLMPDGIEVQTNYVTINQSIGEDQKGAYVSSLDFQVYI